MKAGFAFSRFAERLISISELAVDDMQLLAEMPSAISHYNSHDLVLRRGQQPDHCCLLLQGYLCWKDADRLREQITSIHVPGDIPDLHTIHSSKLDFNLVALGPVIVAFVPHEFFHGISAQSPKIARTLSLLMIADSAALRNWIVNLGSRDATTRVAHLLCEIAWRLRLVGQAKNYSFACPFTQSDLAAACGISAVHANRIIQSLRRDGLLLWQSKTITIKDWPALVSLAGFRPDYLRLRGGETGGLATGREGFLPSREGLRPQTELPT